MVINLHAFLVNMFVHYCLIHNWQRGVNVAHSHPCV